MMSLFSAFTVAVFFIHQCLADNATTTTYGIFGINSNNASYAWDNVYGSVIAADKNAVTVHLDCRPGIPSPSPCGDQNATVTAGPSTWAYTSSSSTYYASMACSKTEKDGTFTCSWHNHLHDSMEINTVVTNIGSGGQASMVITAGGEKMSDAPIPTAATSGTTRRFGGSGRTALILSCGGIGIIYILIAIFA